MAEYVKKSDVLELLSLPKDLIAEYVCDLKGLWIDDDEAEQTENSSEIPNNCEDEPTTQMKTQNSNLTFEKRTMLDCYNCKRFETEDECIECRYEPNTEPNCSEKPNNCEPQTERSE